MPASEADGLLGFFLDVSAAPVPETRLATPQEKPQDLLNQKLPLPVVIPADGPGGCPEGWEAPARVSCPADSSRCARPAPEEDNDESSYPHLQEYLSSRPVEPQGRRQAEEARRYYGGISGSASATQTDDGYLTKFGSRRVCVVCLGQEHKARACPQLRCFTCFESGHETRQCPKAQLKCGNCGRKGHDREGCIWDALVDAAHCNNWYSVRCANCGRFGHPMCSRETRWKDPLEETAMNSKTVSQERSSAKISPKYNREAGNDRWHDEWKGWRRRSGKSISERTNSAVVKTIKKVRKHASAVDAPDNIENGEKHRGRGLSKTEHVQSVLVKDLRAELRSKLANQSGRNGSWGKEHFHAKMNSSRNGTAFPVHTNPKRSRSAAVAAATARFFR